MFNREGFLRRRAQVALPRRHDAKQVDGMEDILPRGKLTPRSDNLRWLSYPLATAAHETGFTMQPIAEYGLGKGMEYGKPDPETGQTYYGRGYVQTHVARQLRQGR